MNELTREDYIKYRIKLSKETYEAAEVLVENEMWNSVVNRLYYASFYMVTALLVSREIRTKTHAGVKTKFLQEFVKTEMLEVEYGILYTDLLDWRQKGDYGDFFDFSEAEVIKMMNPVKSLLKRVEQIIERKEL